MTYEEKVVTGLLGLDYSCKCCGTETKGGKCFTGCENKHASTQPLLNRMISVFVLAEFTVENAEEQDHWEAAHSLNL